MPDSIFISLSGSIQPGSISYADIQDVSATSRILGRKTAGAGSVEECTLSEILDFIGSAAQGDILYRNAAAWAKLGAGVAGQLLKTNGAAANPEWVNGGSAVNLVVKTGDESVQNNTLQNDAELFFSVLANKIYIVDVFLLLSAVGGAAADWQFNFTIPAGATMYFAPGWSASVPYWDTTATNVQPGTLFTPAVALTAGGTNANISGVHLRCIVIVGATPGTIQLQWAQNTTTASNSTVKTGSLIRYQTTL